MVGEHRLDGLILRPVDDDPDTVAREIGVLRDAREALRQRLCGSVDGNDDVDAPRGLGLRPPRSTPPVDGTMEPLQHRSGILVPRTRGLDSLSRLAYKSTVSTLPFPERRSVAGEPLKTVAELRDIYHHGALLFELVHRDLTVRYKRSVLGFFWTMLHPLLLMLIFLLVFSTLFKGRAPHYETYFLSAYVAWNFFSQTTVNAMLSVGWNGPLMKRVRVPSSIFTLSIVVSGLANLGLSLIVLFTIMFAVRAPMHPSLAFVPVSLLIVGIFTFGVSLALTAMSVLFPDVREMVQAGMPALMYLTPIVYPISIIPERLRWIIQLNPMVYIVEIVRDPVYYGIIPSPATLAIAVSVALASVILGWIVFRHIAPHFYAHL